MSVLDSDYFEKKLRLVLAGLKDYTPDELSRELGRLSSTASEAFSAELQKDNLAKVAMLHDALVESRYSNSTEVSGKSAREALSATKETRDKFIREIEASYANYLAICFRSSPDANRLLGGSKIANILDNMAAEKRAK